MPVASSERRLIAFNTSAERVRTAITFVGNLDLKDQVEQPYFSIDAKNSTSTDLRVGLVMPDGADPHQYQEFFFSECVPTAALNRLCIFDLQLFGGNRDLVYAVSDAYEVALSTVGQLRFRRATGRQVEVRLELGRSGYYFTRIQTVDADRFFLFD